MPETEDDSAPDETLPVTSQCVCVFHAGNDFYSPLKLRHGAISSENSTINGSLYTPDHPRHCDTYVTSREQNGSQAEDRRSQQASLVNTLESMPSLYGTVTYLFC